MRRFWLKVPAIAYAALIFILSSLEKTPLDEVPIWNFDKIVHMTEYMIFGILLRLAFTGSRAVNFIRSSNLWSMVLGALYGLSDEIHQYYIPGRICSVYDLSADVVGILLGIWLFNHLKIFRKYRAA
jgi:VanZ family protein